MQGKHGMASAQEPRNVKCTEATAWQKGKDPMHSKCAGSTAWRVLMIDCMKRTQDPEAADDAQYYFVSFVVYHHSSRSTMTIVSIVIDTTSAVPADVLATRFFAWIPFWKRTNAIPPPHLAASAPTPKHWRPMSLKMTQLENIAICQQRRRLAAGRQSCSWCMVKIVVVVVVIAFGEVCPGSILVLEYRRKKLHPIYEGIHMNWSTNSVVENCSQFYNGININWSTSSDEEDCTLFYVGIYMVRSTNSVVENCTPFYDGIHMNMIRRWARYCFAGQDMALGEIRC